MTDPSRLWPHIEPVLTRLEHPVLRDALCDAFDSCKDTLARTESVFRGLPELAGRPDLLARFANGWKATHLKMLAIYGLTCRLHRKAMAAEGDARAALFVAAARTAETSHEDLGLDYDGVTHARLYEDMVGVFLDGDDWLSQRFALEPAVDFQRWVYRCMVVEPVPVGLLCNLMSEIYNHAEYSIAHHGMVGLLDRQGITDADARRRALTYIDAHLEDETEIDHFRVMVEALDIYGREAGEPVTGELARGVFTGYLDRLGRVMSAFADHLAVARAT